MAHRDEIDRQIDALLESSRTASLATVNEHGRPHAANVQYVHDQRRRLYFVSDSASAHARHIARTGDIALTIYAHPDDRPERIHGLQLHGRCRMLTEPEDRRHGRDLYLQKYTFVADSPDLRRAVEAQPIYRVTPTWLRWIDNRRGFGFKHEIKVADPGAEAGEAGTVDDTA